VMKINLHVPESLMKSLNGSQTGGFSRRTHLYELSQLVTPTIGSFKQLLDSSYYMYMYFLNFVSVE
jgi:hypothetical protein